MISSKLGPRILKILWICSKGKKLSATPTLNHVAGPPTNVVDQNVDSSVSTALTPKVNIDTAATEAAASTTLDVSSSVPEQRKQATNDTKAAPVGQPFQSIDPKYDFPVIGLKTKIGNPGYTTMQKNMQLFVLLA